MECWGIKDRIKEDILIDITEEQTKLVALVWANIVNMICSI